MLFYIHQSQPPDPVRAHRVRRERTLSLNDAVVFAKACDFAARAHATQKRKGSAQEPYVIHLLEVAALVTEATGGTDLLLSAAAVLHDVVEDQPVTRADVAAAFGEDVATLVMEVTDDKSLPKAERKRLQVETAPRKSQRAKIIKVADKIANLNAIRLSPPDWPPERKRDYLDFARAVVAGCRGCNPWLEQRFENAASLLEDALTD